MIEVVCQHCGKTFETEKKGRKYCSSSCRKRAQRERQSRNPNWAGPTLKTFRNEQKTFREEMLQRLAERDQKYELIKLKTNIRICGRARIETRGQCFYAKKWK